VRLYLLLNMQKKKQSREKMDLDGQIEKISQALDVTVQTVERVRKQLVQEGFDAVLKRQQYIPKNFSQKA